jgi:hypothetical protein
MRHLLAVRQGPWLWGHSENYSQPLGIGNKQNKEAKCREYQGTMRTQEKPGAWEGDWGMARWVGTICNFQYVD